LLLIVAMDHILEKGWDLYLTGYEDTKIRWLADIVDFNKQHRDQSLPPGTYFDSMYQRGTHTTGYSVHVNQQLLEGALKSTMSWEKYASGVKMICQAGRVNDIDKTLAEFNTEIIIGPMDGSAPPSLPWLAIWLGLCPRPLDIHQPVGDSLGPASSFRLEERLISARH
jgi:hypothetical protein